MEPVRIHATRVRPGHTVRLEYGPTLLIDVTEVHVEESWVRFCGTVSYPGGMLLKHTADSRHSLTRRLYVVSDRNEPPQGNPAWNDPDRVVRQWTDGRAGVWSLDDPDEPIGHGGRYRGSVVADGDGWLWQAGYNDAYGEHLGDYITAERELLDPTTDLIDA